MSSLTYDLTLAGLSVGSAAALTGIGLIVTYRATGVLNFAHGAIAMVCAYALRECTVEWGWPLWLGALVTLCVLAPAIGIALERFVFRPLAVLGGDPARTLVASIGVFVLLVGGAALLWGPGARADAPELVSADPWGQLAVVLVLSAAVGAVTRWTRFGRELRAVVDDRRLAVLNGIDADRVAAAGWAFGSFTAGLTGVLLAPYVRLDPYGMPLLVLEVVAVAVAARMRSIAVAVPAALGVGVAQSQLTRLHPTGWAQPLLQSVGANLFVVALLVAALVLPGIGTRDALPRAAAAHPPAPPAPSAAWIVAGVLFLLPLGFAGQDLHTAVQVPALGVVLLSLVVVTGRGGQISLGQAAYAGLGALFTALLAAGRFPGLPRLPEPAALALAVLLVAPLGLLTGRPAIRRHGLALALATFAVGVGVSRFVLTQPYAVSGLTVNRPAGFGGDRAYYVLELALLAGALLATRLLRTGRTGRALAAMRDHEPGASAAGVRVPSLKLLAFVTGAALAALGGALLTMGLRAFDPGAFDPVRGLLWFAAVVVLGADSTLGALLAAALLVGLDAGTRGGVAAALIGVLAVLAGRFPGGPYEALRAATRRLRPEREARLTPLGTAVRERLRGERARPTSGPPPPSPSPPPPPPRTTPPRHFRSPSPSLAPLLRAWTARPLRRFHGSRRGGPRRPAGPGHRGRRAQRGREEHPVPLSRRNRAPHARAGVLRGAGRHTARLPCPYPARCRADLPAAGRLPVADRGRERPCGRRTGPCPRSGGGGTGAAAPRARRRGTGAARGRPADRHPAPRRTGPRARRKPARPAPRRTRRRARHRRGHRAGAGAACPRRRRHRPAGRRARPRPGRRPGRRGPRADGGPDRRVRTARPGPRRPGSDGGPMILSLRHARVRYGPLEALHGVSLDAPGPGITVLLGRNGSGRTTVLRALAGAVPLSGGAVVWDGVDVTRVPAYERARRGLCLVPERQAVFGSLTVRENLELGLGDPAPALDAYPRLEPLLARRAGTLSGGERRMLALSRVLSAHARVVLVDEPAQGMSPAVAARTYELLNALDACVIVAEQRLPPVLHGRRALVYELRRGTVVFGGETAELAGPSG